MRIYGFDKVYKKFCELNPATKAEFHALDKVRDKYGEILEAIDVSDHLLRASKKMEDINGKIIRGGAFIIPVDSVDFCAEVINRYTSKDFKQLRMANFKGMSLEETQFLIDGFCIMLFQLDYPVNICLYEKRRMERRLQYKLRLSEKILQDQLRGIYDQAIKYENSVWSFNHDDSVYFLRFMAAKVKAVENYIALVYSGYTDGRSEELSKLAEIDSQKETVQESLEKINMDLAYADALEHDDEYQKLMKKLMDLLAEDTFVKLKKSRFNKIQKRMQEIREGHQMRLFGQLLPEELDTPITVMHPLVELEKALEWAEDNISERARREEKEASKTPEELEAERKFHEEIQKLFESKGMNFDLPNTDIEEEELFMTSGNLAYNLKGMIPFPCCNKEKIIAYEGSSGKCSIKCPRCGRFAIFDYDKMKAETGETLRGASHKLRTK